MLVSGQSGEPQLDVSRHQNLADAEVPANRLPELQRLPRPVAVQLGGAALEVLEGIDTLKNVLHPRTDSRDLQQHVQLRRIDQQRAPRPQLDSSDAPQTVADGQQAFAVAELTEDPRESIVA